MTTPLCPCNSKAIRQDVYEWKWLCSDRTYLWTHEIWISYNVQVLSNSLWIFKKPFKNVKIILSLQAIQTHAVGQFWQVSHSLPNPVLFLFIYLFIYLFLAVLGLRFCARAFSSCGKRGPLFIAVRGPLTIAASLAAEHRLQTRRLSNCGSRDQSLRGMWDLPRPGLEPVSPALAGRFSTTAPPGKPLIYFLNGGAPCRILVAWPGIEPRPTEVKAWIPNHWTAREFPMPTPVLDVHINQKY